MEKLLVFVGELDQRRIFRRMACVRDAVMVDIHVPGARWEVEFFADGHVELEIFRSRDDVLSGEEAEAALERLLHEDDEAEADAEKRRTAPRQFLSE